MEIGRGALWLASRKWLKTGSLITAVLVAVYGGVIRPSHAFRGFAMQRATALAAIERNRHWVVPLPESIDDATLAAGVVGGDSGRSRTPPVYENGQLVQIGGNSRSETRPHIVYPSLGETSGRISR